MDSLWAAITAVWVLLCFGAIGICAPSAALGPSATPRILSHQYGAALVWTWLTLSICVPLAASVRGLNWVTALLFCATWPITLWLLRHRGQYRTAFRRRVRAMVYRVVATYETSGPGSWTLDKRVAMPLVLAAVPLVLLAARRFEVRLSVPADFDTLWRTRGLLNGTLAWDPVASLAAVLTHISAADALTVTSATRLGLIALTAVAASILVMEIGGGVWLAAVVAPSLVMLAPWAPAATWTVALCALIAATSFVLWRRDRRAQDRWHACAALALAAAQIASFADRPDVLFRLSPTAVYLEQDAAVRQALRLARSPLAVDSMVVAAPEQQLEVDGLAPSYDLARFVSRFRDRAGDPRFRFDLRARRLFVFVEKEQVDSSRAVSRGRFVTAQPAAYRVPRERKRLAQLAGQICDEYRRAHAGAAVEYDDAVLRIYRIDL